MDSNVVKTYIKCSITALKKKRCIGQQNGSLYISGQRCEKCSTCWEWAVIILAEKPGPLGVFCDPCHGNDQTLHGDRPHKTIPTRESVKVHRVLRKWRQMSEPQYHIHLKRNNNSAWLLQLKWLSKCSFMVKQVQHLLIPGSASLSFQLVKVPL